MIDLYYLSRCFRLDTKKVKQVMKQTGRMHSSFDAFLNRKSDLEHAYDKFRFDGNVEKPPFDEVYGTVKKYVTDFI